MFKRALQRVSEFFNRYESRWRLFYIVLAGFALILQFSVLASLHFQRAESRAVLRFQDPGSELSVSQVLQWNIVKPIEGFYHSPFYARVAFLFTFFTPKYFDRSSQGLSADWMEKERAVHVVLQLMNLSLLYLIAFAISRQWLRYMEDRLLSTLILVGLFLSNGFISQLVFKTQGFVLASFLTFLSFYFLKTRLRLVCLLFGLAVGAHLGALWFLPAFLWIIFQSKNSLRWNVKEFAIWSVGLYLLASFPSYLDVRSLYIFLKTNLIQMELLDGTITVQNILLMGLMLAALVGWRVFTMACLSVSLAPALEWKQRRSLWIFVILLLAPAVIFGFPNAPFWILFPAVLVLYLIVDPYLVAVLSKNVWVKKFRSLEAKPWRFTVAFFVAPFIFTFYPQTHYATYLDQSSCRSEARRIENFVEVNTLQGKRLLVDPDVPYEKDLFGNSHLETTEGIDGERFGRLNPDIIVFSSRPRDMDRFTKLKFKNDFHLMFVDKDEILDPLGYQWLRNDEESSNGCGFIVWEKQ